MMGWKNWPSWVKGGLLFTMFSFVISILLILTSMTVSFRYGFLDTLFFPANFIYRIFYSSPIFYNSSSLILSIPVYFISTFAIGSFLGIFYKKSSSLKNGVKGYLVGITIYFVLSIISLYMDPATGFILAWIYYPLLILSPIIGFVIGKIKSKKQPQQLNQNMVKK